MDRDSSSHTTLRVTGFEPDVFRQLMEFAHTGRVDLMPRTIIGVISSADYYQFLGRQPRNKTLQSGCLNIIFQTYETEVYSSFQCALRCVLYTY